MVMVERLNPFDYKDRLSLLDCYRVLVSLRCSLHHSKQLTKQEIVSAFVWDLHHQKGEDTSRIVSTDSKVDFIEDFNSKFLRRSRGAITFSWFVSWAYFLEI